MSETALPASVSMGPLSVLLTLILASLTADRPEEYVPRPGISCAHPVASTARTAVRGTIRRHLDINFHPSSPHRLRASSCPAGLCRVLPTPCHRPGVGSVNPEEARNRPGGDAGAVLLARVAHP